MPYTYKLLYFFIVIYFKTAVSAVFSAYLEGWRPDSLVQFVPTKLGCLPQTAASHAWDAQLLIKCELAIISNKL